MTSSAQMDSESTPVPRGEQALIASVGGARYFAGRPPRNPLLPFVA